MRVVAFLPVVAAVQVMDTHNAVDVHDDTNYESMKNTLKGISAMQAKGDIDQDTITTVTETLAKINTQLLDALEQDVGHSQNILNTAWNAIETCDTNKAAWVAGDFATNNGAVSAAQGAHNDCRGDEGTECANATQHCNAFTGVVCSWDDCEVPAPDRFSGGDTDEVFAYMNCLAAFMGQHKDNYYAKRQACIDATNVWNAKSGSCDGDQGSFETAYCSRETNVQLACNTYRTCRNGAQSEYWRILGETQALEEIYQAQRVALQCLLCYGEHILNNSTDLSSCDETPDCSDLSECPTIVYTAIPDCIPCTEPAANRPCNAGFLSDEYSRFENTCTPPQQCNACAASADDTEGSQQCDTYPPPELRR